MVSELFILFLFLLLDHLWLFAEDIILGEWLYGIEHIFIVDSLAVCSYSWDNGFFNEIGKVSTWEFLCFISDVFDINLFLFTYFGC